MNKAPEIINRQRNSIMEAWAKAVKKEITASRNTSALALRDHLPALLDDIEKILLRYRDLKVLEEKERYLELFENSTEHGRHRSSSSGYTVDQILREYILFHEVLTNVLMEEDAYTSDVGIIIKYAIENAMVYSLSAFSESLQEMRQKLIGILAHDLRNPVSAAYFTVDIMNYDDGKERFEKNRKMALSSLQRANALIEDLLESISVKAGEGLTLDFSELNIVEYVQSVYREASEIYYNDIKLKSDKDEIRGIFDGAMMRRVLENLVSNAVKYGDREKPVTLSVEDMEESVRIRVHNEGNPIPEEKQKEIFKFLYTTHGNNHNRLKSWGMGLTLVKAVVDSHQGKLELESNEKEGTTFSITLEKHKNKPGKKRTALNFKH